MAWHWVYQPSTADGEGRSAAFPRQGDAESWLGESYPELYEGGVRHVTLFEEGRQVYGPMSLEPDPDAL